MKRMAVVLLMSLFIVLSLAAPALAFPDVSSSHPYHEAIADLSARAVIGGYANGNFGPQDPVTRQQFAKMVVLAFGLPVTEDQFPNAGVPFVDLGSDDPSSLYPHEYVAACALNHITTGTDPTHFAPGRNISRQQLITMVVRAADNLEAGALQAIPGGWTGGVLSYSDPTHGANIRKAEYSGLLAGIRASLSTPGLAGWNTAANATRGEVAQILYDLLGLIEGNSEPSHDVIEYSGNGDQVLDINKWQGSALVWIQGNAGSDYFGVTSYGPGNDGPHSYYDLLVNTTEPYEGVRLVDYWSFLGSEEQTTRLEVKATGSWKIEIRPLSSARTVSNHSQISGSSDEVLLVNGNPGKATITGNAGSHYFGVKAYYGQSAMHDLLVNETDPYSGTVMFSKPNPRVLEVTASDPWVIALAD